ncbi:MAG: hypothetical protein QM484_10060 [Woeseiaceae bacterium]
MKQQPFLIITLFLITFLSFNVHAESLQSAKKTIKEKTNGKILSTKTEVRNGQKIHKIKVLLPSGNVQTFRVDAD